MRIAFIGSIYGEISRMYDSLVGKADWVLSTGNFGVWPDPVRADRRSRQKGTGDFIQYVAGVKRLPIPTLMVGGTHEDYFWINRMVKRGDAELIEDLHYLVNGNSTFLDELDYTVHVVGLGGTHSPKVSPGHGHYSIKDVQKACSAGPMDIFLSHEAPYGEQFGTHVSEAEGISKVCFATRPRLLVHGKYPESKFYRTAQTDTPAICVGAHQFQLLDITKDSIQPVQ